MPDPSADPLPRGAVLDDEALSGFIRRRALPARVVRPGEATATVAEAAAALGVGTDQIVKSLVFLVDGVARLVVAAGLRPVETRLLAAELGVSRKRVRLASPDEALAATGFRVGAMPPFGHRRELPTLVDALSVPESGLVYGGGGARDAVLEFRAETLAEIVGARRVPLSREPAPPDPNPEDPS